MVRSLDALFVAELGKTKSIYELVNMLDLYEEWGKIVQLRDINIKKRKIEYFSKVNFGFLDAESRANLLKEFV